MPWGLGAARDQPPAMADVDLGGNQKTEKLKPSPRRGGRPGGKAGEKQPQSPRRDWLRTAPAAGGEAGEKPQKSSPRREARLRPAPAAAGVAHDDRLTRTSPKDRTSYLSAATAATAGRSMMTGKNTVMTELTELVSHDAERGARGAFGTTDMYPYPSMRASLGSGVAPDLVSNYSNDFFHREEEAKGVAWLRTVVMGLVAWNLTITVVLIRRSQEYDVENNYVAFRGRSIRVEGGDIEVIGGNIRVYDNEDEPGTSDLMLDGGPMGTGNVIVGHAHEFSEARNSLVVGYKNTVVGDYAAVVGKGNTATGEYASILGGSMNQARGVKSTIVGGESNIADGEFAMVVGGSGQEVAGNHSFFVPENSGDEEAPPVDHSTEELEKADSMENLET